MDVMHMLQYGTGGQNVDSHLKVDGFVKFRDKIYVLNESEIKKTIL